MSRFRNSSEVVSKKAEIDKMYYEKENVLMSKN